MSNVLRLVRLARQDGRTAPASDPAVDFPGQPVGPIALSPNPVPSPTVAPGASDAVPNLAAMLSARLTMQIANQAYHEFPAAAAQPLLVVDATLRRAKEYGCWTLGVALTVWDDATGAEVVLPTLTVGCTAHPSGCP